MIDPYNRIIDTLRISVTDRCNLRCLYCMPADGIALKSSGEILSYEEILRVADILNRMGISRIKITGGEPLVRKDIVDFIRRLNEIKGLEDVSLTTNGTLLPDFCTPLRQAGLKRITISLDTLDEEKFGCITRKGRFNNVKDAINLALQSGFSPVKINSVVIKGLNDNEIPDFARLTLEYPIQVRFIEFMPTKNGNFWNVDKVLSEREIIERCETISTLHPVDVPGGSGSARLFRYSESKGFIGFISPLSNRFCNTCGRLRLTADGMLKLCLFSENGLNLNNLLRSGAVDTAIEKAILSYLQYKPIDNSQALSSVESPLITMSRIGG